MLVLVSVYAVDDIRRELLVVWPTVVGWGAQVVGQLRPAVSAEQAGRLSGESTRLSRELWGSYVRRTRCRGAAVAQHEVCAELQKAGWQVGAFS